MTATARSLNTIRASNGATCSTRRIRRKACGLAALGAIWNLWEEAFDEFGADIEEYIDAGACVITVTRWRAKGKESGLALDLRTVDVYELANDKIVRVTMGYADKAAALKAAELSE